MASGASSAPPTSAAAAARLRAIVAMLGHVHGNSVACHYLRRGGPDPDLPDRLAAHAQLSASLHGLSAHVERSLTELFHDYVGATVRAVSPLVAAACRIEGLDLDALVCTIRHDGQWRPWLGGPPPTPAARWRKAGNRALGELQDRSVLRQFQRCGVVIRETGDPRGVLGFRIGGRCLEIAMRTDRMELSTQDGRGVLTIIQPVPETIRLAARGRLLEEVVDLELTTGRGLRIARVVGRPNGGTSLMFNVEPVSWRLPWARASICGQDGGDDRRGGR